MRKPSKKALRELLGEVEAAHAKEFPKVRKLSDVKRMAKRNWARYCRWDANQKQMAAIRAELDEKSPAWATKLGSEFAVCASAFVKG